ncbi:MAG: HAD hydrolase-like protein [Clostridiales bacterium]|nr:HAD hydrolase-like protein [Clostridiales bacterium]
MIKGIFFDFDGVITVEKYGTPNIVSYISKETNIPLQQVETAYRKYNKSLLQGKITHRDMWMEFCEELGKEIDYKVLIDSFMNMTLDREMVAYIKELKEKYVIGMITDNKADRIHTILENSELKDIFDVVIISAESHAQKTEEKIFEDALSMAKLVSTECVFIDNTSNNLNIPSLMGFTTILFDDDNRNIAEFKDKLNKILSA